VWPSPSKDSAAIPLQAQFFPLLGRKIPLFDEAAELACEHLNRMNYRRIQTAKIRGECDLSPVNSGNSAGLHRAPGL
jgi:hypothetical protein